MNQDRWRLESIAEWVGDLRRYPAASEAELDANHQLLRAFAVRSLYKIGMASAKLSAALKTRHPEVPWLAVERMAELASYDVEREPGVLWIALTQTFPPLAASLRALERDAAQIAAEESADPRTPDNHHDSEPGPRLSELRKRRAEVLAIAERHGVTSVRVFGSVARGDATPRSDIDFLVDMLPGRSLLDLAGFQLELQELLQRNIDVSYPAAGKFRDRVLREAVPL